MDIENIIELSDSDSDIENPTNYNEYLDNLTLESFPEPFNIIGQFILSTLTGTLHNYLIKLKANNVVNYIEDLKLYFNYCKNTTNDDYIKEIATYLKLDIIQDKEELEKILEKIETITINIFSNFIEIKNDIINHYLCLLDNDFNIDNFNATIIKNIIPMLKYSTISNIKTK